jgi:transposase
VGLECTDPGCASPVLSEFRTRVGLGQAEAQWFEALVGRGRDRQRLKAQSRQRTDSTPVRGAIHAMNRVVGVAEPLRQALNRLAVAAPGWRRAHSRPAWLERSGPRMHDERVPQGEEARQAYAPMVGVEGSTWLDAMDAEEAPRWWREMPAVATRRCLWRPPCSRPQEAVRWRTAAEGLPPAARMIRTPDELDAHDAKQYPTSWVGDQGHVTESGDPEPPQLITPVETTAGPGAEAEVTHAIQAQLQAQQR